MLRRPLAIAGLCLSLFSCASNAPSYKPLPGGYTLDKLAILVVPHEALPQSLVENMAMEDLTEKGYSIASRTDMKRIVEEQHVQHGQWTEELAAEVGKLLNVDAIFIFELTNHETAKNAQNVSYTSQLSMGCRLVNVEDGLVVWVENESKGSRNLFTVLASLPGALVGQESRESVEALTGTMLSSFPPRN